MGKKQLQSSSDQPSFEALYRMQEEVLRLRKQLEAEEAKVEVPKLKRPKAHKQSTSNR